MSSARDAVAGALYVTGDTAFDADRRAPVVLAALGIPADAAADDVRAAMALREALTTIQNHRRSFAVEWDEGEPEVGLFPAFCAMTDYAITGGDSMAAAVLALATKLADQEATDA